MQRSKKIIYFINDLSFFCSHRLPIAIAALNKGLKVTICYGEEGKNFTRPKELKKFNLKLIPMVRGNLNIIHELKLIYNIWTFFDSEKPDIIHLITIKPYLYGGIVARYIGIPCVVSAVSGMGSLFINNNLKSKFIRIILYPIYRLAFNHSNQIVITQNKDDAKLLSTWVSVEKKKIKLIKGSGVHINNYLNIDENLKIPVVCFASRLLIDKGVTEFISAAKLLINKGIKCKFYLAGDIDIQNPSSLDNSDLINLKKEGFVKVLGYKKNIPKLFSRSSIICLPSYREGFPKTLMEAAAAKRAVITTDVPGCKDAVINNKTGLIVPVKDSNSLAEAIQVLILNPSKRKKMGREGRKLAEKEFNIKNIVLENINIYDKLIRRLK